MDILLVALVDKDLLKDILTFLIMGAFSVLHELNKDNGEFKWGKALTKFFINVVAGWSFYSFLISYNEWFSSSPQKIGVIMIVTYTGSKVLDIVASKIYDWFDKKKIGDLK